MTNKKSAFFMLFHAFRQFLNRKIVYVSIEELYTFLLRELSKREEQRHGN